jgi:cytidylate kinase
MPRSKPVVAIDGPAGSGKTTVARLVAGMLGYSLVDTGALYRCVALAARRRNVNTEDGERLGQLAAGLKVQFKESSGGQTVMMDGEDVTGAIREPVVSQDASRVSTHPQVRRALLGMQRELGREGGVVLEGRDIGTVVFPDAEVKVFLTASVDVPGGDPKRHGFPGREG